MITMFTDICARSQTFRCVLLSVCKLSLLKLICLLNVNSSDQNIQILVVLFTSFSKPAVLHVNSTVLFLKSSFGCLKWWKHPFTAVYKMPLLKIAALCLPVLAIYATDIAVVHIIQTLVIFPGVSDEKRWLCIATSLMLLLQLVRWPRVSMTYSSFPFWPHEMLPHMPQGFTMNQRKNICTVLPLCKSLLGLIRAFFRHQEIIWEPCHYPSGSPNRSLQPLVLRLLVTVWSKMIYMDIYLSLNGNGKYIWNVQMSYKN